MAALETGTEAPPRNGPPNIWLPGLVERFASLLHPNEVICTLRCVDKATAEQFRGRPEFASVRLSRPVPPHAFTARWAAPGAMRDLTLAQRKQLLRLTAASGVVANLEVALEAVGYIPDEEELTNILYFAATAGHVDVVRRLMETGRPLDIDRPLCAVAKLGNKAMCELLMSSDADHSLWSETVAAPALEGGHPELAKWVLRERPEGPTGSGGSLARRGYYGCLRLLKAAAEGCDLATLRSLHQRCRGAVDPKLFESVLPAAVSSRTADWQAKAEWAESQLSPNASRGTYACASAALCPDSELRLAWLLARGYTANECVADRALSASNTAGLELLLGRGVLPGQLAIGQAAKEGRLEALKKLHEHGCPLDAGGLVCSGARGGHLQVVVWAVEELGASPHGYFIGVDLKSRCDLEVLKWLHQHGWRLNPAKWALEAAQGCNLPALMWVVRELGAPVTSPALMDAASACGNVEMMAWLRERGGPWGEDAFASAARAGCEAALDWVVEQGCPMPFDGWPHLLAVHVGDLLTLRCLARLGCPWGPASGQDAVFESCVRIGRWPLPAVRLLVELGCPVDWEAALEETNMSYWEGPADVRQWLAAQAEWQRRQLGHEEGASKRPRAE
ncbi:hypothetical protein GPECTOR_13g616 [Gonium pectorale]|uniref:Ankyrin repeat domain-containing protein n=1 Tax=Gonium pectorale TaxID=33097 RepID=A0A150GMS7_GONPE|nr:hypothetical protein GPECTOR_13g616 [Gonium pectorale]|eukprot:KXZ51129.1 hypothetical protein GPECTOR_13g616 [Gonium pectorale]